MNRACAAQVIAIRDLQADLNRLYKDVQRSAYFRRERAIAAYNKATNIVVPSFDAGDFFLVRRSNDRGHKLRLKWFGPCHVTAAYSSLVYGITTLQGGSTELVQCA